MPPSQFGHFTVVQELPLSLLTLAVCSNVGTTGPMLQHQEEGLLTPAAVATLTQVVTEKDQTPQPGFMPLLAVAKASIKNYTFVISLHLHDLPSLLP